MYRISWDKEVYTWPYRNKREVRLIKNPDKANSFYDEIKAKYNNVEIKIIK